MYFHQEILGWTSQQKMSIFWGLRFRLDFFAMGSAQSVIENAQCSICAGPLKGGLRFLVSRCDRVLGLKGSEVVLCGFNSFCFYC